MGVIAETDVDYGRIFGPFPSVGHIPPTHFIGYLTSDEKRVNLDECILGNTWMAYAEPARTVDEQNTEAYMKDGNIFYRTIRIIRAHEEILVWYSKDFALILGISFNVHQNTEDAKGVTGRTREDEDVYGARNVMEQAIDQALAVQRQLRQLTHVKVVLAVSREEVRAIKNAFSCVIC